MAGTSSLVTWGGLGDNITATNLYLGNGASANQLTVISIFGQDMPSSKTSMWITMPKDAPNDNTYLILEGNDNPPTRATVPLNIALGSKDTPSAVPTATSSSTPSTSSSSSVSSKPSASSSASSSSTAPTKTPSASESSPSTTSSEAPTQSHPPKDNDNVLTVGQTAGIVIGSIGAAGLALGALFLIRRNRRLNNHKRHTELFDEKSHGTLEYSNHPPYGAFPPPSRPLPTMTGQDDKYQTSYSRNPGPTQAPSAYYAMKTLESTDMRDNGFQSRTQISPSVVNNKPDEVTLADRPDKPHSRS
ncbi:hypothetical protein [Absidia glauca]|uniref:Uncharacterized protein n=1 Tax=Absidia glauca TaxID=4829 RepID=A0A163K8S6_ABSGL|nr:hypothetical protein [Absidia glauca]